MRKESKKMIGLASREFLLSIFEWVAVIHGPSRIYRKSVKKYLNNRQYEKTEFLRKMYYWKRQKYINIFVEDKEKYIELTKRGREYIKNQVLRDIEIKRPKRWDGKWRVVIFDIPEKKKYQRDILRDKLKELGFKKLQMSVYVHPFKCSSEVKEISKRMNLGNNVLIMISEIIQGENKLINAFLKDGLLYKKDLMNRR